MSLGESRCPMLAAGGHATPARLKPVSACSCALYTPRGSKLVFAGSCGCPIAAGGGWRVVPPTNPDAHCKCCLCKHWKVAIVPQSHYT